MNETVFELSDAICPVCGRLKIWQVCLYDESLKKQQFSLLPVNPRCRKCGAEVEIRPGGRGGRITVLTGTCGSGKSSVAEAFARRGCLVIDGDCAIQTLRHRTGVKKYAWDALIEEICREIGIVSVFGREIVLSHIIMPEDLPRYLQCFRNLGLACRLILLKPAYDCAVERCRTRTCHTSVTPEEWIRYYYERLVFDQYVHVIDNAGMSVEETVQEIEELPFER